MSVLARLDHWARADPERPAVEFLGTSTTYRELFTLVHAYKELARRSGVGPGSLVAVSADRSPSTVACILGTLACGAACVPIHSAYPTARVNGILQRIGRDLTLAFVDETCPVDRFAGRQFAIVTTSDVRPGPAREDLEPLGGQGDDTLAYLIFTSGSIGTPKGVMISHGSLEAATRELVEQYSIGPDDRVLHCAPLGFDTSISEITRALYAGATLVIAPTTVTSSPRFFRRLEFLRDTGITRAVLPAALLRNAVSSPLPELGVLVCTGEECTGDIVEKWSPGRVLLNAWGSTETTFSGTIMKLSPGVDGRQPIGRPIGIAEVFVVAESGRLCAEGEIGELHVGGAGVAMGYYGQPELTGERFVENVWGTKSARAFATRDLGRWTAEGHLECLGRMDRQVKISGVRVDLLEVEEALRGCSSPRVSDAAVTQVDTDRGRTYLAAAVVLAENGSAPADGAVDWTRRLRTELRSTLPPTSVPQRFLALPALPLNAHGKVDRIAIGNLVERRVTDDSP